jgi:hypothetical protein
MAEDSIPADAPGSKLNLTWDTNTALAVVVLLALLFLWATARGFRGFRIGA